jgi:hypothetical protein
MPDAERFDNRTVLDVVSGAFIDAHQAGIWDAAAVLRTAVRIAIASASLALTPDVIIQHKRPKIATEPWSMQDNQMQDFTHEVVASKSGNPPCGAPLWLVSFAGWGKTWKPAYEALNIQEPIPTNAVVLSPDFE